MKKHLEEKLPLLDEPTLNKIWKLYKNTQSNNTNPLQEQYAKLKERYEDIAEKKREASNRLEEEKEVWAQLGKDIVGISKKLLTAINRQTASESFINSCKEQIKNYENLLTKRKAELKDTKKESISKPILIERKEEIKKYNEANEIQVQAKAKQQDNIMSFNELNYNRLKAFLLSSKDNIKVCAVLQALTWKINKHKKSSDRMQIIQQYTDNDILDCKVEGQIIERLLEGTNKKYLTKINSRAIEYTIILLDLMTDENVGIEYFIKQEKTLPLLIDILTGEVSVDVSIGFW